MKNTVMINQEFGEKEDSIQFKRVLDGQMDWLCTTLCFIPLSQWLQIFKNAEYEKVICIQKNKYQMIIVLIRHTCSKF